MTSGHRAGAYTPRDSVDRILGEWAVERPDLDFGPVAVITRLARLRARLDAELVTVFSRYDLSAADFQVIVTLRRAGAPYRLPQARLTDDLGLTSGTVSLRIDRLVQRGVVVRQPHPDDARVSLVQLTHDGLRLFDAIAPVHLANEDRLLSALDATDRARLAELLRRLLLDFEEEDIDCQLPLGLRLAPAHLARARRVAVGLSDRIGLLITEVAPDGAAAQSGLRVGDLILDIAGRPVRGRATLAEALSDVGEAVQVRALHGEDSVIVDVTTHQSHER
jgi:DNA-binding MarR family transcriptional regulator